MPKYQVRVEAIGRIRVYDDIFVDAPSPAYARQMAVQQAECEANWDEMPSAADTFSDVTAVAVTLDQEMMPHTYALPEVACRDD